MAVADDEAEREIPSPSIHPFLEPVYPDLPDGYAPDETD